MKFIMAIQFILCMETYYVDGEKVTNDINGRFAYTNTIVWLTVDGVVEEYDVTKVIKSGTLTLIQFEDETCIGEFIVGPKSITGHFLTEEEAFTVGYKIKL